MFKQMKVLFTLPFLTINILITLGWKIVIILVFLNRQKTDQGRVGVLHAFILKNLVDL